MERTGLSSRAARRTAAAVMLAGAVALTIAGRASAIDGPVVFGGDNFARHGQFDTTTNTARDGWLAMQQELAFVTGKVGRVNDNSVAAIGARSSGAISDDAGAAISRAAGALGLTTTFVDGGAAIESYFADLRSGAARPRVIWLAGNRSTNSLDTSELAVLAANGGTLATFVRGGGGLIAQGDQSVYDGWLPLVAPGLEAYASGGLGLSATPAGAVALPGITPAGLSVGPWFSAFRGNLNDLEPFVTSTTVFEADGITQQKVLIGGGRGWTGLSPADLQVATTVPAVVDRGDVVRYDITVTNAGPNLATGVVLTHVLPNRMAFRGGTGGPGRPCVAGPPATCTLGDLPVGGSAAVVVFGKVLRNGAAVTRTSVTSQVPDSSDADNLVAKTITAKSTKLRVRVDAPRIGAEQRLVRVRIAVRNTGRRIAKNVVLRSPAPDGTSLAARPPGGRAEGRAAVWDLGLIRPGRTKTVTLWLRPDERRQGRRCVPARATAANANAAKHRDCVRIFLGR